MNEEEKKLNTTADTQKPTTKKPVKTDMVKWLTTVAMMCALAFVSTAVIRIPIVAFLKYDPKDVIIALGGFIWGPLTSVVISVVVSLIEMITISDTGFWGLLMNIIASVSFSCIASLIYKRKRTLKSAVLGLVVASVVTVGAMLAWNYLITPIYLGYPREAVKDMLLPVFLPFNTLKTVLNSCITLLLYKPLATALRKSKLVNLPPSKNATAPSKKEKIALWVVCIVLIIAAVVGVIVWKKFG